MMNVINIRNDKHKISPGYGRKSPDFENVTEQVMLESRASRENQVALHLPQY